MSIGTPFGSHINTLCFNQDPHDEALFDGWYDTFEGAPIMTMSPILKERSLYPYLFGDVFEANWYMKYPRPDIRDRTCFLPVTALASFAAISVCLP